MATIKHTEWLTSMLGNATHSFIDLNTDDMETALIDEGTGGTPTAATVVIDTIDAGAIATIDIEISVSGAVASTTGVTFPNVSGASCEFLTTYKNSGSPATSPLVITWDSATTGLPVTPNGGNIVVTWGSNTFATLA